MENELLQLSFKVGKTRSEKTIFCAAEIADAASVLKEKHTMFSVNDHFDTYCVFEYLAASSLRKYGRFSKEFELFLRHENVILSQFLSHQMLEVVKFENKILNSIGVRKHGSLLVKIEYKVL